MRIGFAVCLNCNINWFIFIFKILVQYYENVYKCHFFPRMKFTRISTPKKSKKSSKKSETTEEELTSQKKKVRKVLES